MATWQAGSQDTVSDWFYDIAPAFAENSWVVVFFYEEGRETAVPLTILNPAPNTPYGWIAPGQCHALELQFPSGWSNYSKTFNSSNDVENNDDTNSNQNSFSTESSLLFNQIPDWQSRKTNEGYFDPHLAWGDVDGDGDLDLAEGFTDGRNANGFLTSVGGIKIYLNENGKLNRSSYIVDAAEWLFITSIAWGDADGDGDLDLAATSGSQPNRIYLNEAGVLQSNNPILFGSKDEFSTSLAWGDMNGDGFLDLAVGNRNGPNHIYINQNGSFTDSQVITFGGNLNTTRLAWADFNNDANHLLDLAVANSDGPNQLFINEAGSLNDSNAISLVAIRIRPILPGAM
ncbi:MAG: VCBS repeat-containing protein [Anaerolineae bacterium]|nr:VCBS repeat-containing protein [Anaerolineae bacterium]